MDTYLFLKSDDSSTYVTGNRASDFRVKLNQRLDLTGVWDISLVSIVFDNIDIKTLNNKQIHLNVLCNLCDGSEVGGVRMPILRNIDLREGSHHEFNTLWKFPIIPRELSQVRIYIEDESGAEATFITGETRVVLLLRRYPFVDAY
jgi:hypothetical protein